MSDSESERVSSCGVQYTTHNNNNDLKIKTVSSLSLVDVLPWPHVSPQSEDHLNIFMLNFIFFAFRFGHLLISNTNIQMRFLV